MQGFYETLFGRRDVRGEFRSAPIPEDVLARLIIAAHHAPSVGLSQPWNFIVIQRPAVKAAVHEAFCDANEEAAAMFEGERQDRYRQLKLQGILDAPVNLCITCDRQRGGDVVLGRTHQPQMDVYSTVCAVQNLWLAARAEDVGVGWVSIFDPERLAALLSMPEGARPVAILCIGHVDAFYDKPMLEIEQWAERMPIASVLGENAWPG